MYACKKLKTLKKQISLKKTRFFRKWVYTILFWSLTTVVESLSQKSLKSLILLSFQTGLILAAILMGLHCLFGGFFIVSRDIPEYFSWMFETTYLKHAIDGAGMAIFGYNRPKLRCNESFGESKVVYCHFQSTKKFMKFLGLSENLPKVYSIIFITLAVIHIAAYRVMRHRLKN